MKKENTFYQNLKIVVPETLMELWVEYLQKIENYQAQESTINQRQIYLLKENIFIIIYGELSRLKASC